MSHTTMWIIIGVCGLGVILGIIRQIDWYNVFSKRWANNPMRGRVYIHFGRDVVFEDADYSYVDDKYIFYTYNYRKEKYAIAIKQAQIDDFGYIRGRIMIHAKFGEGVTVLKTELTKTKTGSEIEAVVGSPEFPERQPGVATIGAVELNASLKSKTAIALVDTIGNRGGMKIMTIILIIAVLAAAVVGFKMYQDNQKQKTQQNAPSVTTTTTTDPNDPINQLIIDERKN